VNNCYVAGSSVFPTGGSNFPTMTLAALALRLADHLGALIQRENDQLIKADYESTQIKRAMC
jgi:choline dehydrogenase-like flavoprotein